MYGVLVLVRSAFTASDTSLLIKEIFDEGSFSESGPFGSGSSGISREVDEFGEVRLDLGK